LRELIGQDLEAITTSLQSSEWKGATVFSGSCSEALLLFGLQELDRKKPGALAAAITALTWPSKVPSGSDLTDRSWDLFSYAAVAHKVGLISSNTKNELDTVRDFRNLIHPAKSIRERAKCDRGTALVGAGAVEHVIGDLKKNLQSVAP